MDDDMAEILLEVEKALNIFDTCKALPGSPRIQVN